MVQISMVEEIKRIARLVDDYILASIKGKPDLLYDASLHYIVNGGKRLRPFLTIESNSLFDGNMDIALPLAAAIEITHNFTLIHDDIMDNDESRHGVTTVHKAYGLPIAILAGDLLIVKAFHLITESINAGLNKDNAITIVKRLAESCVEISEGQVLDMTFAKNDRFPSEAEYIEMIRKKTGVLFEVACEIGALSANADSTDVSNLAEYGKNIGIAFQLVDDLIGVAGDPSLTKKPVGNDIREGKKTLPILLAINKVSDDERRALLRVFGNSRASDDEIRNVVNIIINAGIESRVREEASNYVNKALESIKEYKGSHAYSLRALAKFVVERTL